MKKKILSLILAIFMIVGIAIPAFASIGEPAGYVSISVDANVLGAGFLYEPELIAFNEGENVAEILVRFLGEGNYTAGGTAQNGFMLTGIKLQDDITVKLPAVIQQEVNDSIFLDGELDPGASKAGLFLSGNDYFDWFSGWMYMVNGEFPELSPGWGAGMSEWYPEDGDVITLSFSLFVGVEFGAAGDMADFYEMMTYSTFSYTPADKCDLLWAVAAVNSADNKAELLDRADILAAYSSALSSLINFEASQGSVDSDFAALNAALDAFGQIEPPVDPTEDPPAKSNIFERIMEFFSKLFQMILGLFK